MQIVYISNRPAVFTETIQHIALFLPFLEQAVVCVPDHLEAAFKLIDAPMTLLVVPESEILLPKEKNCLSQLHHQRRNYLLRVRLAAHDLVESRFVMSDDDARPLKPMGPDVFFEAGRYRRYYFYDLAAWSSNQTEFDAGQIATHAVLDHAGFEHLSYASHMPQMIDKTIFLEAATFFTANYEGHALCEWSTYFNFAVNRYPEQFYDAEPYLTLCWPEHPLAWRLYVRPSQYCFENFTPSLYRRAQVFDHMSAQDISAEALEPLNVSKLIRWRKHTIGLMHPERALGWRKYLNPRTWVGKLFAALWRDRS